MTISLPPRSTLSGPELRLLRLTRRVTATEMAPFYGAGRTAVCNVEAAAYPRPGTVARYLKALVAAMAEREAE
jgi:hypothetical protein